MTEQTETKRKSGVNYGEKLALWFEKHGRNLPWRETRDPYAIWIAEIILQQTRVAQGAPYYARFLAAFPDVFALAAADESAVLKAWEGLGYYSRARNLHAAAQTIVNEYGGVFPQTTIALLKLKGVGPYTARAVAAFAFSERAAVVDGNVFRVLSRVLDDAAPIDRPANRDYYQKLADEWLSDTDPRVFNSAMMDLGATVCLPTNPQCKICPLAEDCLALRAGTIALRPLKEKTKRVAIRYFEFYWVEKDGRFLIQKRTETGFWQGLWQLPNEETLDFNAPPSSGSEVFQTKHIFTHFEMRIRLVKRENYPDALNDLYLSPLAIEEYAFPTAIKRILQAIYPPDATKTESLF